MTPSKHPSRMRTKIHTNRLREADRAALTEHFLALDAEDRRLRFGASLDDDRLRAYVARLDFAHDGLFAVHDEALEIAAVVHVALGPADAELGLSVLPAWRGLGVGSTLFARAVIFLRNRDVKSVFIHCLGENSAMMHIARRNHMQLQHFGSEANGRLLLKPPGLDSRLAEWLDEQRSARRLAARAP